MTWVMVYFFLNLNLEINFNIQEFSEPDEIIY
jgi:hypothetical protein